MLSNPESAASDANTELPAARRRRPFGRACSLSTDVSLDTGLNRIQMPTTVNGDVDEEESLAEPPRLVSPSRSLSAGSRKLILHFDARNTVFVADLFSRITVEQALNTYFAGLVWGTETEDGSWSPLSSELLLRSPRPDAVSLYKHMERRIVHTPADRGELRKRLGDFTQSDQGSPFQALFRAHLRRLRWPDSAAPDDLLTVRGNDGEVYHYLLPAFLRLIDFMRTSGRQFCVVVRTFGRDAPHILNAVTKYVDGEHPDFPGPHENLAVDPNVQRFKRFADGGFAYSFVPPGEAEQEPVVLNSECNIYQHWNRSEGVIAVVDDFEYWQRHQYHYTAAKPLWFSQRDRRVQHVLFDDNIRVQDDDSILNLCRLFSVDTGAAPGPQKAQAARTASAGQRMPHSSLGPPPGATDRSPSPRRAYVDLEPVLASRYENVFFVQADLLQSISNNDYFVEKVAMCEANYDALFRSSR